jgi:hypothetical protein
VVVSVTVVSGWLLVATGKPLTMVGGGCVENSGGGGASTSWAKLAANEFKKMETKR